MDIFHNPIYREDIDYIASLKLPWENIENSRILITGAAGLIGSTLVDSLMARNNAYGSQMRITALGRDEKRAEIRFKHHWNSPLFSFVSHDIVYPMPELDDVDYIIHAASNTHPVAYASDPIGTIKTNVFGTYNLLEYAVKKTSTRFVLLSTVEIYGENIGETDRFGESDMGYIDCNTLRAGYPESKRAGEALCNAFSAQFNVDVVIPRLCRIYGPAMLEGDSKAASQFIRNAVSGKDIVLKSEGNQIYSFCYSADAVSALLHIILLGKSGEAYNAADPNSDISLKKLAELLAVISGTRVALELPSELEAQGFSKATRALLDPAKINALGWTARDTIESGLTKTVAVLKGAADL